MMGMSHRRHQHPSSQSQHTFVPRVDTLNEGQAGAAFAAPIFLCLEVREEASIPLKLTHIIACILAPVVRGPAHSFFCRNLHHGSWKLGNREKRLEGLVLPCGFWFNLIGSSVSLLSPHVFSLFLTTYFLNFRFPQQTQKQQTAASDRLCN